MSARTPRALFIDAPGQDTAARAHVLAEAGLHLFWTAAPAVALALSTDHLFDTVLIHASHLESGSGALLHTLATDAHRSLVVVVEVETWPPAERWLQGSVDGAVRRSSITAGLARSIAQLARDGDLQHFRGALDLAALSALRR